MRTRLAALAVIAALALAGCGGADPQDVTADGPATPIPAETALGRVSLSSVRAPVMLAGCLVEPC